MTAATVAMLAGLAAALVATAATAEISQAAADVVAHPARAPHTAQTTDCRVIEIGPDAAPDTLAQALATARDCDRLAVTGGTHAGPLLIGAAVEITGRERPVIDGGGEGTVVVVTAAGATLRGLFVRGSGIRADKVDSGIRAEASVTVEDVVLEDVLYGISLETAPNSVVRGNTIRGRDTHIARRGDAIRVWESHGSTIENNVVEGARDVVIWYSERMRISGNTVRQGRYGLHYMYSHDSEIDNNRLEENSVGAFMMYSTGLSIHDNVFSANHGSSGYGLALKDSDEVEIFDNVMAGNRVGLYLDNSPSRQDVRNTVTRNTIAWNDIGSLLQPSVSRNDVFENAFIENGQQVALTGGGSADGNAWSVDGMGNHWSNYAGVDADGDGIGDLPHVEVALFDAVLERHPLLRLFIHSPAANALDMAARAFPIFRPPPTLTDPAPLADAPPASVDPPDRPSGPLAALALLLVAGAAGVVVWGMGDNRQGGPW